MKIEEIKKSFVGFGKNGEPIFKLEKATKETVKRQEDILKLHREGKLKNILKGGE